MKFKQQMIESLERSIEKANARIEELSEPCVKSLAHSRSEERDFWKKKLKRYKEQLKELKNEKKELIKHIEDLPYNEGLIVDTIKISRKGLLELVKQLDEPQKVVVPQFVAEYIEKSRLKGWDLLASMCFVLNEKNKKTTKWLYLGENKNIFALAWVYGYEVEKEPKYTVRVKGINGYGQYLNKASSSKTYCFASEIEKYGYKTKHTRKELEEDGFGWVFDCPGIEIEEVTE